MLGGKEQGKQKKNFELDSTSIERIFIFHRSMMSTSTSTAQLTKSTVTLKGSAQIVTEFFNYGINSILYQRGIYPPGTEYGY